MLKNLFLFCGTLVLLIAMPNKKICAQSQIYAGAHTELGWLGQPTFQANSVSRKGWSPQMGLSVHGHYRWRDLIAVELGIGQQYTNMKFRDKAFESDFERFEVVFTNKSYNWNYYGALRLMLPLNDDVFLYGQLGYSNNVFGGGTVTKETDFVLTSSSVNQTLRANLNYAQSNSSLVPEFGIQFKTYSDHIFSMGVKYNMGRGPVMTGDYTRTDNFTNTVVGTEQFSSNGNFFTFNFKYSILLTEFERKERTKKEKSNVIASNAKSKKKKQKTYIVCYQGNSLKVPAAQLDYYKDLGAFDGKCEDKLAYEMEMIKICDNGVERNIRRKDLEEYKAKGATEGKCPKEPKEKKEKEPKEKKEKDELKVDKDGIPKTLKDRKVVKEKTVYVSSTNLTFKVWDNGKEVDGDSISLNLNGQWIAEDIGLQRDKKEIHANIKPDGKNFLMMYALNLGKYPPNTAAVSVWDGKREQVLELKSDMEITGALNIVYRK